MQFSSFQGWFQCSNEGQADHQQPEVPSVRIAVSFQKAERFLVATEMVKLKIDLFPPPLFFKG